MCLRSEQQGLRRKGAVQNQGSRCKRLIWLLQQDWVPVSVACTDQHEALQGE